MQIRLKKKKSFYLGEKKINSFIKIIIQMNQDLFGLRIKIPCYLCERQYVNLLAYKFLEYQYT